MATEFERPRFVDGQRLLADDLGALVTYTRDPLAHHQRMEHLPGVVSGLELKVVDGTVRIQPGCFVDDYGPMIVVPAEMTASVDGVDSSIEDEALPDSKLTAPLPVFITSSEENGVSMANGAQRCGPAALGRVSERATARVAPRGTQRRAPFGGAPPGFSLDDPAPRASEVLLGYVRAKVTAIPPVIIDSVVPSAEAPAQYAGLVGSVVTGHLGRLELHSTKADPPNAVRLIVTESEVMILRGQDTLFKINQSGDVTAQGALIGTKGVSPAVISGRAFGRIKLPLPLGNTEDQVKSGGDFVAGAVLSPQLPAPVAGVDWRTVVCDVDSDRRGECCLLGSNGHLAETYNYVVTVCPKA
jgi:hypothetical protein